MPRSDAAHSDSCPPAPSLSTPPNACSAAPSGVAADRPRPRGSTGPARDAADLPDPRTPWPRHRADAETRPTPAPSAVASGDDGAAAWLRHAARLLPGERRPAA